jgi:phosphoribosylanthranilate isomerase
LYASSKPENYDCEQLVELCKKHQIIWGLDVSKETIINTINSFKPFAINVSGGTEEQVGIKDFDDLNELLEIITLED